MIGEHYGTTYLHYLSLVDLAPLRVPVSAEEAMRYSPSLNLLTEVPDELSGELYGAELPEHRALFSPFQNHLEHYPLSTRRNHHIFMRHGDAENNHYSVCYAHPALAKFRCALTESGRARVEDSVHLLLPLLEHPPIIVTSPFLRARQSAEIAASITGSGAILVSDALRERFFGEFDLHPTHGVGASVYELDKVNPFHTYYGVESVMQVLDRTTREIASIDAAFESETILWVSHLYPLQILRARGDVRRYFEYQKIPNGGVFHLDDSHHP